MSWAVVIGGGRASRLGGIDKAALDIDGRPLVEHVYAALGDASIVAVGPRSLARPGVTVVREDPPFGGPVAALAAGVAALPDDLDAPVWVLACDLPRAGSVVDILSAAPLDADTDAVVLRDADGREQWLTGRYRASALRRALAALAPLEGAPMRRVAQYLSVAFVDDPDGASADIDTWDDVRAHRGR